MATSIFCNPSEPEFVQLECGTELGGIVAIAFIDKDETPNQVDLQTLSFWNTKVNASPTNYHVVKNTRGSYPGGTPVEEEGYGKSPTLRTGADHEANVEVRGFSQNRNFWGFINQVEKWNMVFITNSGKGLYVTDASVYAKFVIDQSIKSTARTSVNAKWSDDLTNPLVFDASALDSIFID